MANQQFTLYEVRDHAAWITLNRPEARNALSSELVVELFDHLRNAQEDSDVRAIVLTGAGTAFCAGADLESPPGRAISGERVVPYDAVLSAIWHGAKPVIAAVNGYAFAGGLGLVGAADIAIAAAGATFSFSEVRIGLIPAMISVVCLRKIGAHHGMRLFLTGERFGAEEAVAYGLAHRAVPAEALFPTVAEEVEAISLGGPNAVTECKKLVRVVPELSIEEGFERTRTWSRRLFESEEGEEGMAAFREKRKPRWVTEG